MEIAYVSYVIGGVLFGLIFGELIRPIRAVHIITGIVSGLKRAKPTVPAQIVDDSTVIRCGACQSVIMSRPVLRTVTNGRDTIVYQCQQCGTQVAVQTS